MERYTFTFNSSENAKQEPNQLNKKSERFSPMSDGNAEKDAESSRVIQFDVKSDEIVNISDETLDRLKSYGLNTDLSIKRTNQVNNGTENTIQINSHNTESTINNMTDEQHPVVSAETDYFAYDSYDYENDQEA